MIGKIITTILQFLDDTLKNMRCYSRCCQINECSCSNIDISIEDEGQHHHDHRHRTLESIRNHSHHSSEKDDVERALQL